MSASETTFYKNLYEIDRLNRVETGGATYNITPNTYMSEEEHTAKSSNPETVAFLKSSAAVMVDLKPTKPMCVESFAEYPRSAASPCATCDRPPSRTLCRTICSAYR